MSKYDDLRPSIKLGLKKLASYCSYQERCQQEVYQKLRTLGFDDEDTNDIIHLLIQDNYLNEERYAKAFCRGKFSQNKWGKDKIRRHLRQKEISDYCIRKGLAEIEDGQYHNIARMLVEKKSASIKDKNHFVRKKKIMNYMHSKGYEYELIMDMIN